MSYVCGSHSITLSKIGKVGRKAGWTKSDEALQEQYSSVIEQLKKGYPIRLVAKSEGVGVSTEQRMIMGLTKVKSITLWNMQKISSF